MCTVEVEHKNNRKKCKFFVVPMNRQPSLGMSDRCGQHNENKN